MKKVLLTVFTVMLWVFSYSVNAKADGYIVKFTDDADIPCSSFVKLYGNTYYTDNEDNIKGLEKYTEYIEPDYAVELTEPLFEAENSIRLQSAYNEETVSFQAGMINADLVWDLATYGNDVRIAVIDSGCNSHIDIAGNLAGGFNYLTDEDEYIDNKGHGTHIAGIIAAEHNGFGIMGIAPKAKIYALKCFDEDFETTISIITEAIQAAVDVYDCKIINMSFCTPKKSQALEEAIQYASQKGAVIIASVGNYGNNTLYYPAGYDEVIGVGSVDVVKRVSDFSVENSSVFVTAPGENCESLKGEKDYVVKTGTSQAAAIVTAAAALMFSADDKMTAERFKELIVNCSEDLGKSGYDTAYGYGFLDIWNMLEEVMGRYYISPITSDGAVVYNNTDDTLSALGIWALYSDNKYKGGMTQNITLAGNEKIRIDSFGSGNDVKFFLWDSLNNIKPLAGVRFK